MLQEIEQPDRLSAVERIKRLEAQKAEIIEEAKADALARAEKALQDLNALGVGEYRVVNRAAPKRGKKGAAEAKYHNPANPSQKCAGRGMKPVWLKELLDQGRKLEDFKIQR
jgi:DNA-binding protein H-NS